ncbi:MAG: metallophosphoesterase [Ignavibacteria bacterium]|nr:metallophosphoesterase [Ignavibacteria bacterium]
MKIAHISDLHLDLLHKRDNYSKSISLLEYIVSQNPDHIVISGDLTENADSRSFELARNLFLRFNLLDSEKLTLVPGNHDIFGGVFFAEDIINFPSKCRATKYNEKLHEFMWWFRETFRDDQVNFPTLKEFDNCIMVGFNSVAEYSILKNPLASNGKISGYQLKRLDHLLKGKDKFKIAVTHHHFSPHPVSDCHPNALWSKIEKQTMKLRKKKSVIRKFTDHNIKIVLHGHLHESAEYHRKGIKFINAGGSILGEKNSCSVSFIEIGSETRTYIEKFNTPPYSKPATLKTFPLFDEYGDPLSFPRSGISFN